MNRRLARTCDDSTNYDTWLRASGFGLWALGSWLWAFGSRHGRADQRLCDRAPARARGNTGADRKGQAGIHRARRALLGAVRAGRTSRRVVQNIRLRVGPAAGPR